MRFPEWLYKLLPGDEGSQQLGVRWREATLSAALVTVDVTAYSVPNDKVLVLTNAAGFFNPGAGQLLSRLQLLAFPEGPAGTVRYSIVDRPGGVADANVHFDWQGEVVIPPGWGVVARGVFDSGVAANSVNVEIHGYVVPRGTFNFG